MSAIIINPSDAAARAILLLPVAVRVKPTEHPLIII